MHACCDSALLKFLRERGDFRRRDFLGLLGAALAAGCSSTVAGIPSKPSTGPQVTLLTNGNVLTLAGGSPKKVSAVAIAGGKILAVAQNASTLEARYPKARTIDLHGATLAPGFIEAHAHVSQAALNTICHNVSHYSDLQALLDGLKRLAAKTPKGQWLFAQGVDTSLLPPNYRPPSLAELDAVSSDVPIFIEDSTGHLYYVNSLALKLANVVPGQRFRGGGLIGGNGDGIEGIVYEFATKPFFEHAPPPDAARLASAILEILSKAQRAGCTTWHDPAAGLFTGSLSKDLAIYEGIATSPNTPLRLMSSIILTDLHQVPSVMNRPRATPGDGIFYTSSEALWMPSLKVWVDGTPQGETANLTEDYLSNTAGFPRGRADWSSSSLAELVGFAKRKGWSLLMHVNGDAAIDQALSAVRSAFGNRLSENFRIRFEHCTITRPDQFDSMKGIGITPTFLNNHTYIWGDAFRDRIIGNQRAQRLDAAGDAASRGMAFSFHCDWGVSEPQPLRYMQTAVTRRTKQGTILGADLAITPLEALKGCTIYPAMQLGFDRRIGTIEAGKDADFVELAGDPLTIDPEKIADIPVIATWKMGTRIAP
jgi:predicted amidohydrolase YtcJ